MTSATTLLPETEVWSRTDAELVDDVRATLALRAQLDGLLLTQLAEVDSRGIPARRGCPTTRAWLRSAHRIAPTEASALVRTALALRDDLPAVGAALAAGEAPAAPHTPAGHGAGRACRQADDVARLEALLAAGGLVIEGSAGQPRLAQAVTEVRQGRLALVRMLDPCGCLLRMRPLEVRGVVAVRFGRSVRPGRGGLVMARRRAPEPPSGGSELPPPDLFGDSAVTTRMVAFIEPGDPPGGYAAYRRLKDAQHDWLLGHGYEGRQGHMDWGRFNRDHNRPFLLRRPAASAGRGGLMIHAPCP